MVSPTDFKYPSLSLLLALFSTRRGPLAYLHRTQPAGPYSYCAYGRSTRRRSSSRPSKTDFSFNDRDPVTLKTENLLVTFSNEVLVIALGSTFAVVDSKVTDIDRTYYHRVTSSGEYTRCKII